jgi:hypothetical protein
MSDRPQTLQSVLDGLMRRYRRRVADVEAVVTGMREEGLLLEGDEIENDHIAFRTIGAPNLGIASLERVFRHYGYIRRERYDFTEKKVHAHWYSPPSERFPRIFISELHVEELSARAQHIIRSYTDEAKADPVDAVDLDDAQAVDALLHRPLWRLPSREEYIFLLSESEYAAWVAYNRYYLNHFTIAVHALRAANDLETFNAFLERRGIRLNDAGGKVKRSDDGLLLQSATVAQTIEAEFAGGEILPIAGSYVEFAERRVLPEYRGLNLGELRREHRRDGFEVSNADKIFESTYTSQTTL